MKKKKETISKKQLDDISIKAGAFNEKEVEVIEKENYEIMKDNRLIQKATFDFNELELKCINYAIAQIKPNQDFDEKTDFVIKIKELCNQMRIKSDGANYENIKNAFKKLRDTSKWVKLEDGSELAFSFLCKAKADKRTGVVIIRFYDEMLQYLKNLQEKGKYTPLTLYYTLCLNKKYAIRLYELCMSWKNNYDTIYKKYGFVFYLDKMRYKWQVPEKYTYGQIKQKILLPSKAEINMKTNLDITIHELKEGKKVKNLFIEIQEKDKDEMKGLCDEIDMNRHEFLIDKQVDYDVLTTERKYQKRKNKSTQ